MPRPAVPPRRTRRRFLRAMRFAAALAIVSAALAVLLVARGGPELQIHRLLATALAIGLAVLIGTGAMMLHFLGDRRGHQADGGAAPSESDSQ